MRLLRHVLTVLPATLLLVDFFVARWAAAHTDGPHLSTVLLLALLAGQAGLLALWYAVSGRPRRTRIPVTFPRDQPAGAGDAPNARCR